MNTGELRLAVLHKVVSELEDAGKTRLQKIGYFLQETQGIPTKYRFRMHHYGPFSEALETDVSRLEVSGYIDVDPDPRGYGFHVTPTDDPMDDWALLISPFEEQIDLVLDTFGKRQTHDLELAATIHFIRSLFPDVPADETLRRVKALKPRFEDAYIRERYEELERLRLIEAELEDDDLPF